MTVDIKETKLRLNFSFVLTVTLMLIFCRQDVVIMSLIASFFHEMGHILFMVVFGEKILSVDFGAFGIRIEKVNNRNISYKRECLIALGGIIINFVLAFLSIMYYYFIGDNFSLMFSLINILLASFNCVPLEVLDMGRALRCFLMLRLDYDKASKMLNAISFVFVNVLAAACLAYTAFYKINVSLIAVTVYLYIITLFKKWS